MNTKTKYYFLIKNSIVLFIVNIVIGLVKDFFSTFDLLPQEVVDFIIGLIGLTRTLIVLAIIAMICYLLYQIYRYFISVFYQTYHISVIEALYHGFVDIHLVYDKIIKSKHITSSQVDFKRSTIYFTVGENHYSVKFLELFGLIEGKLDSEFWAKVSKPKKEYSRKVYTKRMKFPNPYVQNRDFCENLELKGNNEYKNIVVLSGFYKMDLVSDAIIAPYEILDYIK